MFSSPPGSYTGNEPGGLNKLYRMDLSAIFHELSLSYHQDHVLIDTLWDEIQENHSSTLRHYHNLTHVGYMIEMAMKHKSNLLDPNIVLYSIFYHDLVYDPKRLDNEERSAALARDRLSRLGVPEGKITKCQHQILATGDHRNAGENDTNYLLDFDLAILGESPQEYNNYSKKIRQEYSMYPDLIYNTGRRKVLLHFLDMERIFKTPGFYDNYEQQARENLKDELERLQLSL